MTYHRRGIAFTDVVILLVMLALLTPALVQVVGRSRETANRVKCGSNLRQIGQALLLYAHENTGHYPRTTYQPGFPPTRYTGARTVDPFGPAGPEANDVTAAMYLLLRTQDLGPEAFVCPSTVVTPLAFGGGKAATNYSNFPAEQHLSFSLANPYPDGVAVTARVPFGDGSDPLYAVAADMNPGVGNGFDVTAVTVASGQQAMQAANSRNHQGVGQNVLYGDGHVEFQHNPFCGVNRDHIYTVAGSNDGSVPTSATVAGPPAWTGDSVLLPVATRDPHRAPASAGRNLVLIVCGLGLLIAIVVIGAAIRSRARA